MELRTVPRAARRAGRELARRARIEADWAVSRRGRADLALFHELEPSPSGGGHQFLRALARELGSRGLECEWNRVSRGTTACLFNSFNFDFARLRRFARDDVRMVHRVDGPVGVYRGFDDGTDERIAALNGALADATILQSRYSLEKHVELGFDLRAPVVISNAVDPAIFHPPERRAPLAGRKVRLIASSWSDNRRKGAETLAWLDRHLDWERYEMTFVGHAVSAAGANPFGRAGHLPARSRSCFERTTCTSRRAETIRARTRSSRRSAAACRRPSSRAGVTRSSSAKAGCPSRPTTSFRTCSTVSWRRSRSGGAAISIPTIAEVADRYLATLSGSGFSLTPV